MNEETARTGIRVRKAGNAQIVWTFSPGRGAKKKDPNCIQIRVLLWRRGWDSNPRDVSAKLISSQPRYDHFDTSACFACGN